MFCCTDLFREQRQETKRSVYVLHRSVFEVLRQFSCSRGWSPTPCLEAGFELLFFLPPPSKCWNRRQMTSCSAGYNAFQVFFDQWLVEFEGVEHIDSEGPL